MPQALKVEFEIRNGNDKMFLLLSPLGGSYVKEWSHIYCNIASFVLAMYKQRHAMYIHEDAQMND